MLFSLGKISEIPKRISEKCQNYATVCRTVFEIRQATSQTATNKKCSNRTRKWHIILCVLSADASSRWLRILIQGGSKKASTPGVRWRSRPDGSSDRWVWRFSFLLTQICIRKRSKQGAFFRYKFTAYTSQTCSLCCIFWYRNTSTPKPHLSLNHFKSRAYVQNSFE